MNTTIDNSPEAQADRFARGLINVVLATALEQPSKYTALERKAIRIEAARRLRWRDAWEKTATT